MKNKLLVKLIVPQVDEIFDVYIPINKKIGKIISLLNKSVSDFTNGTYVGSEKTLLYDRETGEKYDINILVINTNIRNGSSIILI